MISSNVAPDAVLVAQFDDNSTLLAEIGSSMFKALMQGNAVVSIATGTHRRLLERQLTHQGVDMVAVLSAGQYVSLNAFETLSTILVADAPDVIRFAETVGAAIDRAAANHRRVLIFGELVTLMHAQGKCAGAFELKNLWRSFVASRPMFVRCEHPALAIQSFGSISFGHRALNAGC